MALTPFRDEFDREPGPTTSIAALLSNGWRGSPDSVPGQTLSGGSWIIDPPTANYSVSINQDFDNPGSTRTVEVSYSQYSSVADFVDIELRASNIQFGYSARARVSSSSGSRDGTLPGLVGKQVSFHDLKYRVLIYSRNSQNESFVAASAFTPTRTFEAESGPESSQQVADQVASTGLPDHAVLSFTANDAGELVATWSEPSYGSVTATYVETQPIARTSEIDITVDSDGAAVHYIDVQDPMFLVPARWNQRGVIRRPPIVPWSPTRPNYFTPAPSALQMFASYDPATRLITYGHNWPGGSQQALAAINGATFVELIAYAFTRRESDGASYDGQLQADSGYSTTGGPSFSKTTLVPVGHEPIGVWFGSPTFGTTFNNPSGASHGHPAGQHTHTYRYFNLNVNPAFNFELTTPDKLTGEWVPGDRLYTNSFPSTRTGVVSEDGQTFTQGAASDQGQPALTVQLVESTPDRRAVRVVITRKHLQVEAVGTQWNKTYKVLALYAPEFGSELELEELTLLSESTVVGLTVPPPGNNTTVTVTQDVVITTHWPQRVRGFALQDTILNNFYGAYVFQDVPVTVRQVVASRARFFRVR